MGGRDVFSPRPFSLSIFQRNVDVLVHCGVECAEKDEEGLSFEIGAGVGD